MDFHLNMSSFFIWVPLFLLLSLFILIKRKLKSARQTRKKLPPSPPKLPIIGHLHLLGSLPHRSLTKLSRKYGPVMLLKFGCVPTIIISSAYAAREVLKAHDLDCCSRPKLPSNGRLSYNYLDMALSPYDHHWRELRKFCTFELFSIKRVQSFQPIRETEIDLLLKTIGESAASATPVDLSENSYLLTASVITRIAFGNSFRGSELDDGKFHEVIRRAMSVLGGFSAANFFPYVGWIIDWVIGFHARTERSFVELDTFFQHVIDSRINSKTISDHQKETNIIDVLLKMEIDGTNFDGLKLTRDRIKAVIMDLFLGGVDTGAITIVWAMTELIRNPRVMKKVQNEIRNCIKGDRVKEKQIEELQYLKIVIKEVFRLHAPAPLLLPRETMSHFKLNDYDIDPKTHIHINAWGIGRDPNSWENPEEFFPERFMEDQAESSNSGSIVDYKGQSFELIPFGSGRRICPGINMGISTVELALANLLLCFDWKLPNGMKEEDIEIEEEAGLTISKKLHLKLVPVNYIRKFEV